ncbi:hypothetical protein HMPREF1531_00803 [Propionibacterium sp. oral taxon 192 str. F0372]|uniref:GNAT family N-acetyltransferase n=1 Tax=Propionibacterium sp. oral taxon 192 TaxID=671222 RepID=UPI000353E678|nr:GNAT family N-acetyltransferase [Propionibacterium sp. oral taxon 192]EPH06154.1 hypothetical protein HMPREF1531_00803 [Propionibacterium sp. oral taxon 192 str. F0372]
MEIIRVTDGEQIGQIFDELIFVSFPPDERCTREEFVEAVVCGSLQAFAIADGDSWAAVVTMDEYGEPEIRQLSWVAVAESRRGEGLGSLLLEYVIDEIHRQGARFLVGEVEDPASPTVDPRHGDPAARAAFYRRHGAKALPLPYQQPPLGPELNPVPLMLMVFSREPVDEIPVPPLRRFLHASVGHHEPTWAMVEPWLAGETITTGEVSTETFRRGR